MCLIIVSNPASAKTAVSLEHVRRALSANSDGAGIAWADGKLHIVRDLSNNAERLHGIMGKLFCEGLPFVFHARFATHGVPNVANCHPVQLSDTVALAHNGVLGGYGSQQVSDTREFCRVHLRGIDSERAHSTRTKSWLEALPVMSASKFAIISADGTISIINEDLGHHCSESGLWFSGWGYAAGQKFTPYNTWGCYAGPWDEELDDMSDRYWEDKIKRDTSAVVTRDNVTVYQPLDCLQYDSDLEAYVNGTMSHAALCDIVWEDLGLIWSASRHGFIKPQSVKTCLLERYVGSTARHDPLFQADSAAVAADTSALIAEYRDELAEYGEVSVSAS